MSKTPNAWKMYCRELATWAWDRLAIKRDRHGMYSADGSPAWSFSEVTEDDLAAHFAGEITLGLGATSLDDQCLWVAWDMDNHVSDVETNQNLAYAIVLRDSLRALGFNAVVIEDSDGKGGIHVWCLFAAPIPAKQAHEFSVWVARDYKKHGLEKIECFPKNSTVQHTDAKCGTYLRDPGKHHKRDHWSRFYGVDAWLSIEDSVQLLLSQTGDDPALIPVLPEERPPAPSPQRFMSAGQSTDRDEALAVDALNSISPEDYDIWLKIGQALHSQGHHMLGHWIDWSRGSEKYKDGECESKWKSFHRGGERPVSLGTLFFLAESNGWIRPQRKYVRVGQTTGIKINAETGVKQLDEELPANAVELLLDEKTVNDAVVSLLAARGDLFDHNGSIAVISDEHVDGEESRKTIHHLSLATLREIISETCRFYVWGIDKETEEEVPAWQRIPKWCYEAVLARGSWTGIRPIRGIVSCPVLRADGSILQTQGYDSDSGLYVDLTEAFPEIDSDPTAEAISCASATLFDLVSDFPFKDSASLSAWVASLLTPLAREAYRGCTGPLFTFDANIRGSGKSLLADINSLIVTGREATRLTAPQNDEEARKRITALVNDSDRIVLIDNITGRFGCASLDAALTGTVWKDRRLGHTELIEAPLRMTWYASGNNVILAADTARRVCHIRLESPLENPEDRSGFKYADIRKHVRKNRPALLAAALTILRGYIAAARPDQNLKPWGSFEGWSDLVRNSIVWCGLVDPGETRTELRLTSDSEAGSLRQMLVAVAHVDQDQHGLRTSDMLKIANARDQSYAADDVEMMREAIEMFCGRSIVKANAQHLGNQLSHFRNRVVDQMAFDCTIKRGSNYWFVQSSGGPVVPGGPDSTNLYALEKTDVQLSSEICIGDGGENRYTTSTRSTTIDANPNLDWLEGSPL
jgi:hypothetical protein